MTDILVNVSMRFPSLDRTAVAEHIEPVVTAALRAGGITTNVSVQEYDEEADDDG